MQLNLEQNLITPDGFAWQSNWDTYAAAIRRKLVIEMAQR